MNSSKLTMMVKVDCLADAISVEMVEVIFANENSQGLKRVC
jgi:hypothetical protein